ncbi:MULTISPECIES: two-partner secretion domain-containing protein [Calothrix]|uniref:S-layer family protein n=2 Tax=Calothrix TaxID=1186 RepID=A0ABR8ACJ3_9CYAN|nr:MULTISPECIES: filamentous hemagglutinin N-terminal domain-containing protein [Calothrix]MBD2197671.1 S-layer family protein [Calothrix parietina FACHB-288]MBD2225600.1 S-layer family protein [Calothrix anomala FACHB-343]
MPVSRNVFVGWFTIAFITAFWGNAANAQITPDGSLGTEASQVTPNVDIKGLPAERIDGGATRGANLFHSFSEFNIRDLQRVYFSNPTGIENILMRVTGGKVSNILGTLGVNGNANLFLMNPNGIVFGKNARLDLGGSFVASTANSFVFGDGLEFSATNPQAAPLLQVNLTPGLQYGNNAGSILNQSSFNNIGLRVQPGKTLALVGGDVFLDGGILTSRGGRIELGSVASNSLVNVKPTDDGFSLDYEGVKEFQDINFNSSFANVSGEGGGDVQLQGRRITFYDFSSIDASTLGSEPGGTLAINAVDSVELYTTALFAEVLLPNATGKGGNLTIRTNFLKVADGSIVSINTYGIGDSGKLTIRSKSVEVIGESADGRIPSGLVAEVERNATGNGGVLTIETERLKVANGAILSTSTLGKGNAGEMLIKATDIEVIGRSGNGRFATGLFAQVNSSATGNGGNLTIETNKLTVAEGAQIGPSTFSSGKAGNLRIIANQVEVIGRSRDGKAPSGLFAQVNASATGDGGDLIIETDELIVTDGALLSTSTFGGGKAGNLKIIANKVEVIGTSPDNQVSTRLATRVNPTATKDGGDLIIETGQLTVANGAQLETSTFGDGKAGNLKITATEVEVIGTSIDGRSPSALLTQVIPLANGNGGNLNIETDNLTITDGALLSASTGGKGNAGDLKVSAIQVKLIGTSANGQFSSGLFTQTESSGNAGKVEITTDKLFVEDGARISAATSGGKSNDITINANSLTATNGGQLRTTTSGENKAGNITLKVTDDITLTGTDTGIFANTTPESQGNGGNIFIDPRKVTIQDGAKIAVDSQGTGIGGDVELFAGLLTLDNGQISAQTRSNTGGNINLNLQDLLLLRNGSQITTTAGNQQFGGDGGNITINTPFIVAVPNEDSDITANAFSGTGGKVNIATNGIFGIQSQPRLTELSDITASSELGVNGEVSINTPEVDPSRGLEELPESVVDVAGLINQNLCTAARQGSEFVVTGRGGLPVTPYDILQGGATWEDWHIAEEQGLSTPKPGRGNNQLQKKSQESQQIVEAQGWITHNNGDVILTAKPAKVTPQGTWLHPLDCRMLRES